MAARVNPLSLARQLTHQQRVTRLYRNSLKHLLSWTMSREIWRPHAVVMRSQFDENKHLTDRVQIEKVLQEAEAKFEYFRHPAPYIGKYCFSCCKVFLLIAQCQCNILLRSTHFYEGARGNSTKTPSFKETQTFA